MSLASSVTEIIMANGVGDSNLTVLDLTRFTQLRLLEIGNNSLCSVTTVKIIGLSELMRVKIGKNSFAREYGSFHLKNCPRLKSLGISYGSFSAYTVCEIEGTPELEVIPMGESDRNSFNFRHASLELRSM